MKTKPVEKVATEIVVALIVAGEQQHREGAQRHYEWMVRRKAQLIEEVRRRKEEAERREQERQARLDKERVERLLADAVALRQSQDIRTYVQQVKELCANGLQAVTGEELRAWEQWALAQADRIDPVNSGKFWESIKDSGE